MCGSAADAAACARRHRWLINARRGDSGTFGAAASLACPRPRETDRDGGVGGQKERLDDRRHVKGAREVEVLLQVVVHAKHAPLEVGRAQRRVHAGAARRVAAPKEGGHGAGWEGKVGSLRRVEGVRRAVRKVDRRLCRGQPSFWARARRLARALPSVPFGYSRRPGCDVDPSPPPSGTRQKGNGRRPSRRGRTLRRE
jgi:hypothetical protein